MVGLPDLRNPLIPYALSAAQRSRRAQLPSVASFDCGLAPQALRSGHTGKMRLDGKLVSSRYRVIRCIAKDGMGEVYEIEDRELQGGGA